MPRPGQVGGMPAQHRTSVLAGRYRDEHMRRIHERPRNRWHRSRAIERQGGIAEPADALHAVGRGGRPAHLPAGARQSPRQDLRAVAQPETEEMAHGASVPIAKFASICRKLSTNFAIEKDTSDLMILV